MRFKGNGNAGTDAARRHVCDDEIERGEPESKPVPPGALSVYRRPPIDLLTEPQPACVEDTAEELKKNAETLIKTLAAFGVQVCLTGICRGPTVTRYELQPGRGVRVSQIANLADDIALYLAVMTVRIAAPAPNETSVGVEVPNRVARTVRLREIIASAAFAGADTALPVALGRDIEDNIVLADLGKMPHVLVAGSTGSGNSNCIDSILLSLLYKSTPDEVRLLLIDPKVMCLAHYSGIPHLLVPNVTDCKKAVGALEWAVTEMLGRYKTFTDSAVQNIDAFNRLAAATDELRPMPRIVIVVDELADLMMTARDDVEDAICRLAQTGRAAGIHMVIATARPVSDTLTGLIKANIPTRIAFAVGSQLDSRVILDVSGAERLLGRGDMLYSPLGEIPPWRVQGCLVDDKELERVTDFCRQGGAVDSGQAIAAWIDCHTKSQKRAADTDVQEEDELLPRAVECILESGYASASLLQRRLKLGYARAGRIIDQLEQRGIVGPHIDANPRAVLISKDTWAQRKRAAEDVPPCTCDD